MANYRTGSPQIAAKLARFRRQMADVARGEYLRKLRRGRHLSQETAAHLIGVSAKTIRSWEKGGGIKWRNAKRAGELYGVDPESLVTREEVEDEEVSEPASTADLAEEVHQTNSELAEVRGELSEVRTELERVLSQLRRDARGREGSRND